MGSSIVYEKAFSLAIEVVELYKYLCSEKKEFVLSNQLLRSGTSIGANIREGLDAQSKKDFISKLSISLKESSETEYWLELLIKTGYVEMVSGQSLLNQVKEIRKMLNSIILTAKKNLKRVVVNSQLYTLHSQLKGR